MRTPNLPRNSVMKGSDSILKVELPQIDSVQCVTTEELPPDFYHEPPEGYSYEVTQHRRNMVAIWIINHGEFSYTDSTPRSIWGFYNTKTKCFHAPINSKTVGKEVRLEDTTPYSAMSINHNALQQLLYA